MWAQAEGLRRADAPGGSARRRGQLVDRQRRGVFGVHLTNVTPFHVTSITVIDGDERGVAMGLNLDAVGTTSDPSERSWDSKDALLYALGVGAGALDPTGFELEFTTENSDGVTQRVLPTFTAIVGQGGGRASIGDYDPAMLVHGEQSIRLHGEIPPAGTVSTTTTVAGMYDKGSAGLVVLQSESRHVDSGELAFTNRTALFIRGAGGFGGPRNPGGGDEGALAAEPVPARQ